LFLLYDYTFRVDGLHTKEQSLAYAHQTGIVCADEVLLHPDPYPNRQAWCRTRVAETERRLVACDRDVPLVLVNHWPLIREPTRVHRKFSTAAVVYGHLHIPCSTVHDGVRFEEVSLGYPREWTPRGLPRRVLRPILPTPESR
jgi:hypothetical protein